MLDAALQAGAAAGLPAHEVSALQGSLLALLALLGFLAVARALERPSAGRLLAVAAVTAGLVLLHYWALYLVATVLVVLAVLAVRGRDRAAFRTLLAVGAGSLALVPWLGVLRYQLEHTGTPWTAGTRPFTALTASISAWGGGGGGKPLRRSIPDPETLSLPAGARSSALCSRKA